MGIGDWFKKTFGKQPCAFCGAEVGMLKRTKIKNKEFICNDCKRTCSRFTQVYRMTKDELLGHMEYMKRQEKLYNEVVGEPSRVVPTASSEQSIEFYDDCGMFRIRDNDYDGRYTKELFRYDQVVKYEPFCNESEPEEKGKPMVFDSCGVTITLAGAQKDVSELPKGIRPHPYIQNEIEVVVNKRDKHIGMLDVNHIISHFDYIFGVHDDTKGLFSFGPTTQQKREGEAMKAMAGMFGAAIKAACGGGESPKTPKADLTTFEMTCELDYVDEPAKATVGYPKSFTKEESDWSVTLTDEAADVQIEVFISADTNYTDGLEYAKEEHFFCEEGTFGGFKGYATMIDEASSDLDVNVYLGCVAEIDDVYLTFRICSASQDMDADPQALYKLEQVQQVLNSAVYTAPAEPAE